MIPVPVCESVNANRAIGVLAGRSKWVHMSRVVLCGVVKANIVLLFRYGAINISILVRRGRCW